MGDLFGLVDTRLSLFETTNQLRRHGGTRAAARATRVPWTRQRQLMPAFWQSGAILPAQTSAAFWPPSSMTAFTLSLVMACGSSRIDGTSRPPVASLVVPV